MLRNLTRDNGKIVILTVETTTGILGDQGLEVGIGGGMTGDLVTETTETIERDSETDRVVVSTASRMAILPRTAPNPGRSSIGTHANHLPVSFAAKRDIKSSTVPKRIISRTL